MYLKNNAKLEVCRSKCQVTMIILKQNICETNYGKMTAIKKVIEQDTDFQLLLHLRQ